MLYSISTSVVLFAVIVGIVAWFAGFSAAVRAFGYRTSQLFSTQLKALQPPGVVTAAEQAERSVGDLKHRMLRPMLVLIIAVGSAAGLILLRNWVTGGSG